jgi:transcriptional regulator with XRE-family HTH domain
MNKKENPEDDAAALPWEATFAKALARLRLEHGMSQTELARRSTEAGLPLYQQQIQRIENLSRPVRLNEALLLAQILNGDPWVMAAQMVDDQSAYDVLDRAQESAESTALRTVRTLRDEYFRLSASVREAAERLAQYVEYVQTRGPGKYSAAVEVFRQRQDRITATLDLLEFALHQVTDEVNQELHLVNISQENRDT